MLSQSESPIYFKIPSDLKDQFDTVCKRSKTTKTKELFEFIKGYIEDIKKNDPSLLESTQWVVTQQQKKTEDLFKGFWWEK